MKVMFFSTAIFLIRTACVVGYTATVLWLSDDYLYFGLCHGGDRWLPLPLTGNL